MPARRDGRGGNRAIDVESDLLVLCLRPPQPARDRRIADQLGRPLDWERLVWLGLQHGVVGLLFVALLQRHQSRLPADIAAAARVYLQQETELARRHAAALSAILEALRGRGIAAVPFKGPALAQRLYGHAAGRPCRDLDFLIRDDDVDGCLEALAALGFRAARTLRPAEERAFRRYAGQYILFGPDGALPLEPHWAFAPRTLAVDLDYSALWQRLRPAGGALVTGADPDGLRFEDEDLLLLLCLHGGKEEWARLRWVADLARFLAVAPALRWDVVRARAAAQGCRRIVGLGLALAGHLLAAPVPPEAAAAFAPDRATLALLRIVQRRLAAPGFEPRSIYHVSRFRLRLRERFRDRARYVLRTMLTPRVQHFGIVRLPGWAFPAYRAVKLAHDYALLPVWRLAGWLRQAAFASAPRTTATAGASEESDSV